jgi:hypothetical protein
MWQKNNLKLFEIKMISMEVDLSKGKYLNSHWWDIPQIFKPM